MAFEFDGVFIGATWTRDMRNLMLAALGLYLALFFALRPFGNAGLWTALLGFLLARGALQGWRYRALADATFPRERSGGATAGAVGCRVGARDVRDGAAPVRRRGLSIALPSSSHRRVRRSRLDYRICPFRH